MLCCIAAPSGCALGPGTPPPKGPPPTGFVGGGCCCVVRVVGGIALKRVRFCTYFFHVFASFFTSLYRGSCFPFLSVEFGSKSSLFPRLRVVILSIDSAYKGPRSGLLLSAIDRLFGRYKVVRGRDFFGPDNLSRRFIFTPKGPLKGAKGGAFRC